MNKSLRKRNSYNVQVTPKRTQRGLRKRWNQYIRNIRRNPTGTATLVAHLLAPKYFTIRDKAARADVVKFLRRLKTLVASQKRSVSIDFTNTIKMFPGGTLLFTATLDRLVRTKDFSVKVTSNYPKNPKVEEVLQQIGVLKLLKKPPRKTIHSEDVKYWRYSTGTQAEGQKAGELTQQHAGKFVAGLGKILYAGLVEAMVNSHQHAYALRGFADLKDSEKSWWMFSQERENRLVIAFCDLGAGIPTSLKSSEKWTVERIRSIQASLGIGRKDADYIRVALSLGKSSTQESHRGKGLADLKRVVDRTDSGILAIYSNSGLLEAKSGVPVEALLNFGESIEGTLIHWTIPLGGTEGQ